LRIAAPQIDCSAAIRYRAISCGTDRAAAAQCGAGDVLALNWTQRHMPAHTTTLRPVPAAAIVTVDLGDGTDGYTDRADVFNWGDGAGPEGMGRIVSYAVLGPAETTDGCTCGTDRAAAA